MVPTILEIPYAFRAKLIEFALIKKKKLKKKKERGDRKYVVGNSVGYFVPRFHFTVSMKNRIFLPLSLSLFRGERNCNSTGVRRCSPSSEALAVQPKTK